MTTRKKAAHGRLRITQVASRIGNQERVVRVLTDGLGLGRIGSSVVRPDNPYTRGMIAKVAHIVRFEELAAETRHVKAEELPPVGAAAAEVEATAAPPEPRKRAPRKRASAKSEE